MKHLFSLLLEKIKSILGFFLIDTPAKNKLFVNFLIILCLLHKIEEEKFLFYYYYINIKFYIVEDILLNSIFKPIQNIIIISILLLIIPVLITVALLTLMERKMMATLQRRRGPNIIGFFGLLQPFADGIKLLTKEFNIPGRSYDSLVTTTPMISLLFTCSCFALIPLSSSYLYYTTNSVSALYIMAISSLNIYSIIMAGWSSKSAYAFLGSLRASAQFISYEVSLTLNIMGIFLISNSFNLVEIAYIQEQTLPNIFVLFPIFLLYLIGVLSETNRTPYDLAEAESELVAGYGVEFSAVGFAFFFIAEYASIILYCLIILNLFFAGFIYFFVEFLQKIIELFLPEYENARKEFNEFYVFEHMGYKSYNEITRKKIAYDAITNKQCFESLTFSFGVFILLNFFVHIRATYARYRFDQLMKLNWKNLLILSLIFDLYIVSILLFFY